MSDQHINAAKESLANLDIIGAITHFLDALSYQNAAIEDLEKQVAETPIIIRTTVVPTTNVATPVVTDTPVKVVVTTLPTTIPTTTPTPEPTKVHVVELNDKSNVLSGLSLSGNTLSGSITTKTCPAMVRVDIVDMNRQTTSIDPTIQCTPDVPSSFDISLPYVSNINYIDVIMKATHIMPEPIRRP